MKTVSKSRKRTKANGINKSSFANRVILLCVIVSLGITAAVVYEYHRLDTVPPSGVLGTLFGFWGGELLIIALRQIFGSDIMQKDQGKNSGSGNDSDPEMFP